MTNGAPQSKKKGLGPLAWIGIGCGVLLLIGLVVISAVTIWGVHKAKGFAADMEKNPGLTAARMVVKLNPELEEVDVDPDAGTMTVRNTKTGEVVTVDFEDIEDGRIGFSSGDKEVTFEAKGDEEGGTFSVKSNEGEMSWSAGEAAGELPPWVMVYPGTTPTSTHSMKQGEGYGGGFELVTDDGLEQVSSFYQDELEKAGFEVGVNTFSGGDESMAMVSGTDEAADRQILVNARTEEGRTRIVVSYNQGL